MVTAEDVRFVVRKAGAVKTKVVATFVVRVRLADPKMRGQHCRTKTTLALSVTPVSCTFQLSFFKAKQLLGDF